MGSRYTEQLNFRGLFPLRPQAEVGHPRIVVRPCWSSVWPLALCMGLLGGCTQEELSPRSALQLPPPLVSPDIVLVTLDTVRADRFSCYGYGRETSPHLDELATSAVRFARCLAPAPTTLPSHTSMFTGLEPNEHGVLANLHEGLVYERYPGLLTLAETLQNAGYATGGFVSAQPLRKETGISAGFQTWSEPRRLERPGSRTMGKALEWLSGQDRPLFLWVHIFDPHNPYLPEEPWGDYFDPNDGVVDSWMNERGVHAETRRLGGRSVDMHAANEAYDGELRASDEVLGQLLDVLRSRERWDQTLLMVIGDHGEGLGQHGEPSHGLAWDDHLHVPWIVRVPDLDPAVIEEPVSVTDLLPTLLGRMNLKGGDELRGQCSGLDRLQWAGHSSSVHSQSSPRQSQLRTMDHAWTQDRWKYLRREDGSESLFDLLADPHEARDLAPFKPQVVSALRSELENHLKQMAGSLEVRTRAATPTEEADLKALGYGGDEDSR